MALRNTLVTRLGWALCALVAALATLGIALNLADLAGQPSSAAALIEAVSGVLAIPFALVAALVISRQPRNIVGWLLMLPAVMVSIEPLSGRYLASFAEPPAIPTLPLILLVWHSNWSWLSVVFPLVLIPLFFPDGRPPGARWRWLGPTMVVEALIFIFFVTFTVNLQTTVNDVDWSVPNPIGFVSEDVFNTLGGVWSIGLGGLTLLCVASLFVRYRRAGTVVRMQIKWLLYACGLFSLVYVAGFFLPLDTPASGQTQVGFVWNMAFTLASLSIPAAIAVAILRYHLWDIDVIIRRTLIYSVLTGILGIIYFGAVLVLQPVVTRLTGQGTQLTRVLFSLMIAALFAPARRWVQAAIDRRFYRGKYNSAHTLAEFAAGARDETDLDQLTERLGRAVDQTVQPAHVGLWLKGRTEKQL